MEGDGKSVGVEAGGERVGKVGVESGCKQRVGEGVGNDGAGMKERVGYGRKTRGWR